MNYNLERFCILAIILLYLIVTTGHHKIAQVVKSNVTGLHEFKSFGPNKLHSKVLKEFADILLKPLLIFFENSWKMADVPQDWI